MPPPRWLTYIILDVLSSELQQIGIMQLDNAADSQMEAASCRHNALDKYRE
jgi:hypothetical protein